MPHGTLWLWSEHVRDFTAIDIDVAKAAADKILVDIERTVLADEVLTPDSSRYWPADQYEPGKSQPSFDKQYVRDWANAAGWDHNPPAPELPEEVVAQTQAKYREAYERITGREL